LTISEYKLDELGAVSRGRSRHRPRDAAHLYGGSYPFVQTADVKRAGLYLTKFQQTYNEQGLAQSKLWPVGTLCITIAANIADTSILGIEACFPDSVIGFVADPDKADVRYIKYFFDAVLKRKYSAFTQGATQDNLSQSKLLSIALPVPDVAVQRRRADVLAAYDNLIENNHRRIELLEMAARELYKEWFVRFRFPGHEHIGLRDGVPEGWECATSDQVMDILSGGTPKTTVAEYWDGEIPFYTPKDATRSIYVFETEKRLSENGLNHCASQLYPKDTLFVTARGTVGKVNLAGTAMAMNQSCYALVAKPPLTQHFLFFALRAAINQLKGRAVGAVFNAVIKDTFKGIPIVLPPANLVVQFSEFAENIARQTEILARMNIRLRKARDLLLPKLMTGEITV
jgi:type I restriction enzyme, S subunit